MTPINETPGSYSLHIDRGYPVGASEQGDGRLALHVNVKNSSDAPVPVYVTNAQPTDESQLLIPNEITSVPQSIVTDLFTYTVAPAHDLYIYCIAASGNNVATYDLLIDGVFKMRRRTWFGADISTRFDLKLDQGERGFKVSAGSVVKVTVVHNRPFVGNFEATLFGVLVG